MGDRRFDREDPRRPRDPEAERELSLGEAIDLSVRKVVTAIVAAGGLIALGAYAGGGSSYSGPHYQVTAADGRLYRVNTDSGTVIACEGETCTIVLQRDQHLVDHLPDLPPAQRLLAPAPRPAVPVQLPAPSQAPPAGQVTQPAPAPAPAH